MTHDQLLAFVTVVAQGSFSRASKVLGKSQPAVSKLVRNLEVELGLTLLDRETYRPCLTDEGRRFHARAVDVVTDTEALRSFGRRLAGAPEPEVCLVLEAVTPLGLVVPVLQRVQARYPAVRYALRTERFGGVLEALREGAADLVVTTMQGVDRGRVEGRAFASVEVFAAVRFDHPLARAGSPVPSAVLREFPQIVLRDSGPPSLSRDVNVLQSGRRWLVTDVEAKRQLIAAGMGWGGLPAHACGDDLARGTIVRLDVREFDTHAIELCVLRRRDRARGVVAEALWAEFGGAADPRGSPSLDPNGSVR